MESSKNQSKKLRSSICYLCIVVLFAISLYVVEWSSIGSESLGQYNNGYGTFDMKSYSINTVSSILGQMQPKGFEVYQKYFIADYFFILIFGTLQIVLLNLSYQWLHGKRIKYFLWCIPILRGIFDIIENTLLIITIRSYPKLNETIIQFSSKSTYIKLMLIKIWIVLFVVGIIGGILSKLHSNKNTGV